MSDSINKVRITYSDDILSDVFTYLRKQDPLRKKKIFIGILAFVFGLYVAIVHQSGRLPASTAVGFFLIFFGTYLLLKNVPTKVGKFVSMSRIRRHLLPYLKAHYITISPNTMIVEDSDAKLVLNWDFFSKANFTESIIFLHHKNGGIHVIPYNCMSKETWQKANSIIKMATNAHNACRSGFS